MARSKGAPAAVMMALLQTVEAFVDEEPEASPAHPLRVSLMMLGTVAVLQKMEQAGALSEPLPAGLLARAEQRVEQLLEPLWEPWEDPADPPAS